MKAILIFFLFCFLYFEETKGQQLLTDSDFDWPKNVLSEETNNDAVVPQHIEQKNKEVRRKHKKSKSMRRIKKQINKKQKRKGIRKFRRRDKKGAKAKKNKNISKNMKKKNAKRDKTKKKQDKRTEKKTKQKKKTRKQKKKKRISRKRSNKNKKYHKKNTKTKIKKEIKMKKKIRKENKKRGRKMPKKYKQQRTHELKRKFYKPNGDNGETGIKRRSVQEFECDIFGYTRDFSVALTQINRVNRILNKPDKMDGPDGFARTDFSDAIDALGAFTREGTGCYGSYTPHNNKLSRIIYDTLQFCKNDVPSICDRKKIAGYDEELWRNATKCEKRLASFVKQYRATIFDKNHGEKYQNVCPNLGLSWNSQVNPTESLDNANAANSSGDKIQSPDTPLELWRDHCLPNNFKTLDKELKARFDVCKDPLKLVPGSYGSCMAFLQASLLYVDVCNPYPAMFGRVTAVYTWINVRVPLFENILKSMNELSPYNTTTRSYGRQTNDSKQELPVPVGPNLNFSSIIEMMRPTNCTNTTEYDILVNCNVSIPEKCNSKPLEADWKALGGDKCYEMMKDFTSDYELIIESISNQSSNSQVSEARPEANLNSSISGYYLPLISNCIDVFCFSFENQECSLAIQNNKVTKITQLMKQFFISFEFKSREGPPTKNISQNVIQLMDSETNTVLSLSVNHKMTTLIICSESNCKSVQNAFTADKWHHVEFTQALANKVYAFQVKIDGIKKVNIKIGQPKTFKNVDVFTHWMKSTVNIAPTGFLRNMFINANGSKTENKCKVYLTKARSSSIFQGDDTKYGPLKAIDGKTSLTEYFLSSYEDFPWLEVQLSSPTNVSGVTILTAPLLIQKRQRQMFLNAVIRAGPNRIKDGTTAEMLTVNPVCGTFEGQAAIGATINVECTSPIMAEYISVQLNYTRALLHVDEITVNPQVTEGNDYKYLNNLRMNITKANCFSEKFEVLDANLVTRYATCTNETVTGSYGNCAAVRDSVYSYITSCVRTTTPAPSTTTGNVVTPNYRRSRKQFYMEKFLAKKYSK